MTKKSSQEGGAGKDDGEAPKAANDNTLHKDQPCPIACFGGGYPNDYVQAQTLVQLRGEAPPPWFPGCINLAIPFILASVFWVCTSHVTPVPYRVPGYFVALPQTGGAVHVKQSPAEVLQAAYKAARPSNIPPESRFVY